jgi:anti-anti-sigma factor
LVEEDHNFSVTITRVDGFAALSVSGAIDLASVPQLDIALLAVEGARRVAVDLAGVDYIDSSGLALLMRHRHRLGEAGRSLRVCNPSLLVRRLLKMTGLDTQLIGSDE